VQKCLKRFWLSGVSGLSDVSGQHFRGQGAAAAPPHQRGFVLITITLRGNGTTRQLSLTPLVRTIKAGRRSFCSATSAWDCRSYTMVSGTDYDVVANQSMNSITSYTPSFATNSISFSLLRRLAIRYHTAVRTVTPDHFPTHLANGPCKNSI
jgi:hypothetical protein